MTAERGDSAGVRLHVGGLARGVNPKELAGLIARALPSGASPTAEIMRDASTGVERGFGYVTVPAGEGVKAGAERAIAAYNGSRWRGNKIRVGFAKGDYLQRLKGEWDEAAKAKDAAAATAKAATLASATAPYKARPSLRLRRRPGERIILVDPTPIAWTKPPRQDSRSWNKSKEKEAKEKEERQRGVGRDGEEEGEDESGPHRRKRGLLGCRRRVEFPGRAATCSTKCRELWRRHLQEQAAEASAARQRSVDRFISGKTAGAVASAGDAPNGEALPQAEVTEEHDGAEYLAVEDAADLVPEEPPAAEGIEFVWDDAAEDAIESGSDGGVEGEESGGGGGSIAGEQDGQEHSYHMPASRGGPAAGLRVQAAQEGGEESDQDETPAGDGWEAGVSENDVRAPVKTSEERGVAPAGRAAPKKLERLGNSHGLELDDRLAELLSDGSDDDEETYGDGGYDYELETAKRAGIVAANVAVEEPVEGMRDRLQAEAERSLGVLAQLFGGESTAPARPAGEVSGAASAPVPALDSGVAGVDNLGGANAASPSVPNNQEAQEGGTCVDVVQPKPTPDEQQQEQQQPPPNEGETPLPGAGVAAGPKAAAPGEERFVAHMSTLTDIFTVQDKVSTKKSREEKEKDKGFKVASLFDGLVGGEEVQPPPPAGAASAPAAATAGDFSFAFGSGVAGVSPTPTGDCEGAGTAVSAAGRSEPTPSPQHSAALPTASSRAGGHSTQAHPALTSRSATSALGDAQTAMWRPLGDIVAVAARFVRSGKRENVEAAWLGERHALTQDFKRKHKDAVKGRRGAGACGVASKKRKRR